MGAGGAGIVYLYAGQNGQLEVVYSPDGHSWSRTPLPQQIPELIECGFRLGGVARPWLVEGPSWSKARRCPRGQSALAGNTCQRLRTESIDRLEAFFIREASRRAGSTAIPVSATRERPSSPALGYFSCKAILPVVEFKVRSPSGVSES